jgi:hypothetical protein
MLTNEALKTRARAIAEMHFYSDDECEVPWEPFEDWPDDEIQEQVADMAQTIFMALLWARDS